MAEGYVPKVTAWDDMLDELIEQANKEVNKTTPDWGKISQLQDRIEQLHRMSPEEKMSMKHRRSTVSKGLDVSPKPEADVPARSGPASKNLGELFGDPSAQEAVRSNKTNKPGRLAKKAFEASGGIRAAVKGPEGKIFRAGPGGIHAQAIENRLIQEYGANYPMAKFDELADAYYHEKNFGEKMGFSTAREGYVTRDEMQQRAAKQFAELEGQELHAGRLEYERGKAAEKKGPAATIGEARRGTGPEAERTLRKRKGIQKMEQQINKEIKDLERRPVRYKSPEGVVSFTKTSRSPTGKHSPYEVTQRFVHAPTPEAREHIKKRIQTLKNRRDVIRRQKGLLGPTSSDAPKVYGKLANLARGLGRKGMRALGPLGWMTEPGATWEALKEMFSGDEEAALKAMEYFQGLPEGSTGRGLTETEKKEREDQNLPWYDPRLRQGGI
jgi:hypothetical protein